MIQGETRKCSYSLKIELIEKVAFLFDVTIVNKCYEENAVWKLTTRKTAFSNDPDLQAHELHKRLYDTRRGSQLAGLHSNSFPGFVLDSRATGRIYILLSMREAGIL